MTVPVITEFLQQNPEVELVMVSRQNFKDLFEGIPKLTFIGIDLDDYKGILGLRKLGKRLLKEFSPTYIADLQM